MIKTCVGGCTQTDRSSKTQIVGWVQEGGALTGMIGVSDWNVAAVEAKASSGL